MPLAMVLSPDGRYAILSLSGYRLQGLQVIDRVSNSIVQTTRQRAAFIGLAFSNDGQTLYASGGNEDRIYKYRWAAGRLTMSDSITLAPHDPPGRSQNGQSYPAGLSLSPDGSRMYVAENLYDSLAVVDVAQQLVVQRLPAGRYPYTTAVDRNGRVYVSSWATDDVLVYRNEGGRLVAETPIHVARHPSALLLNRDASRLFIVSASTDRIDVVDAASRRIIKELTDFGPDGKQEGSTPSTIALSSDGTQLYVGESDNNAVAVFDLSSATSGVATATGNDMLAGRIPTDWYPTAIATSGDTVLVATSKGHGTAANPNRAQPATRATDTVSTVLEQLRGSFMSVQVPRADGLRAFSARVANANQWNVRIDPHGSYPPFEHVVYIIKENRTYDQVLGDLPSGDGDTSLVFFPRAVTPNHHALAERFGLFDRFFTNAEVSAQGHNWSTAAYTTDYNEKTVPSNYGNRGRSYDYEGTNRDLPTQDDDDAAEPANGYIWDLAQRANVSLRNFGEYVMKDAPGHYIGTKPFLAAHTNNAFPEFDLSIRDQKRADIFLAEFAQMQQSGVMPQLTIIRLPNDHTSGASVDAPTPRAYLADNDLALGRIVQAISQSRFWASTVMFVLEDDAQDGPDHVDSHRSPLFVISPYTKSGVIHRFANTTDVVRTMSEILGMGSLSQFDRFGRPLRDIWNTKADLRPFVALTPAVSLDEKNPRRGGASRLMEGLDLSKEDRIDDDLFNRILWTTIKGENVPYPGPTRMPVSEIWRDR